MNAAKVTARDAGGAQSKPMDRFEARLAAMEGSATREPEGDAARKPAGTTRVSPFQRFRNPESHPEA